MSEKPLANAPGPGGSLGICAVCGGSFAAAFFSPNEGAQPHVISLDSLDSDVCVHGDCIAALERARDSGWEALPEGPLRRLYADAASHPQGDQDG